VPFQLAESEESREKFADSALKFLAHYNFDGLDFDWEYPAMVFLLTILTSNGRAIVGKNRSARY
jgi:chitinase